MADIQGLQNAINRFSVDPTFGFAAIAVDGSIGKETLGAAILALDAAATGSGVDDATLAMANGFLSSTNTVGDLNGSADEIAAVLTTAANELGYGFVQPPARAAAPQVKPSTAASQAQYNQLQQNKIGISDSFTASIANTWSLVPIWGKLALGALLGVGAIFAFTRFSKKHHGVAGLSDMWLVDHTTGAKVRKATPYEREWFHYKGRVEYPAGKGKMRRYDVIDVG